MNFFNETTAIFLVAVRFLSLSLCRRLFSSCNSALRDALIRCPTRTNILHPFYWTLWLIMSFAIVIVDFCYFVLFLIWGTKSVICCSKSWLCHEYCPKSSTKLAALLFCVAAQRKRFSSWKRWDSWETNLPWHRSKL